MSVSQEHREVTSPFQEESWVKGGVPLPPTRHTRTPFRPEAPAFDPRADSVFNYPVSDSGRNDTASPYYPAPANTFMPPETPPLVAANLTPYQSVRAKHFMPSIPESTNGTALASYNAFQASNGTSVATYFQHPISEQHFASRVRENSISQSSSTRGAGNLSGQHSTESNEKLKLMAPSPQRPNAQCGISNAMWAHPFDTAISNNATASSKADPSSTAWSSPSSGHSKRHSFQEISSSMSSGWTKSPGHELTSQSSASNSGNGPTQRFRGLRVDTQVHDSPERRFPVDKTDLFGSSSAWYQTETTSARPASALSNGSFTTQTPTRRGARTGSARNSPVETSPERKRAQILAQAIRNGFAEGPSDSCSRLGSHSRQSSAPGSLSSVLAPPTLLRLTTPAPPPGPDRLVQNYLTHGHPALEDAFNVVPFAEDCRNIQPANWGVVRISDIPYGTTKPEVVASLGRNARIAHQPAGSPYFAIHIIMERATAKSNDCFIEFDTVHEAQYAVQRFQTQLDSGRPPRIGDRKITMTLCGQEDLMKELFPRAKCVQWRGQTPVILGPDDPTSSGFQGFISGEELVMTTKYAEYPSRRHEQRVYESMISLLVKYPWFEVDICTLEERDRIFETTLAVTCALAKKLRSGYARRPLTVELLQELLHAGLTCPGFSEPQRAKLVDATGDLILPAYVTQFAGHWPFEILRRKSDASEEIVMYFVSLLKEATTCNSRLSLAERSVHGQSQFAMSPFGDFVVTWPSNKGSLTLAQAAKEEWEAVEAALREVLFESTG